MLNNCHMILHNSHCGRVLASTACHSWDHHFHRAQLQITSTCSQIRRDKQRHHVGHDVAKQRRHIGHDVAKQCRHVGHDVAKQCCHIGHDVAKQLAVSDMT